MTRIAYPLLVLLADIAPQYATETIDRLFLELSQFTNATSFRELALRREIDRLRAALARFNSDDLRAALAESLRDQLKRHGYHLTDEELADVARNTSQAIVLLDKESA